MGDAPKVGGAPKVGDAPKVGGAGLPFRGGARDALLVKLDAEWMLFLVGACFLGAALVLPRATLPASLPLPEVDFRSLHAELAPALEVAERADAPPSVAFPRPVRRVGERVRRLGASLFRGSWPAEIVLSYARTSSEEARRALIVALDAEAPRYERELKSLLSFEAGLFVRAVRAWEDTGRVSLDLVELGGDFVEVAQGTWLRPAGRLPFSDEELVLLFQVRFALLAALEPGTPLAPTQAQRLAYYGLLLRFPPTTGLEALKTRLGAIDALAKLDVRYPAELARGLVWLDGGQAERAVGHLEAAAKSGPWARQRQNALLWAHRLATSLP